MRLLRVREGQLLKRTFQAIRIEVNDELGGLETTIDNFLDVLAPMGRLCIITFHSLKDRMVKKHYQQKKKPLHMSTGISRLCTW